MSNISIIGAGYVGLPLGISLSSENFVYFYDVSDQKIDDIQNNNFSIDNKDILLSEKDLNFTASTNLKKAVEKADFIFICLPTDQKENSEELDISIIYNFIAESFSLNKNAIYVIKSTIPIGASKQLHKNFNNIRLIYSPEFVRENNCLKDTLYPSRVVFGGTESRDIKKVEKLFKQIILKRNVDFLKTDFETAEAIKLFSNTYLAMRVGFFNEIDTFASLSNINSKDLIKGLSLDDRIGDFYNNPSFGFGGYCLPKDTAQAKNSFVLLNQRAPILESILDSNIERKKFIANEIVNLKHEAVGIYRINMKKDSDNFRSSAVIDIIEILKKDVEKLLIFEPLIKEKTFMEIPVIKDFNEFKSKSSLIIANRLDDRLLKLKHRIYSKDIFKID